MIYFANLIDLITIPKPIFSLTLKDWFDPKKMILNDKQLDEIYIKITGNDEEQIKAKSEVLKSFKKVRNGGGVRLKVFKKMPKFDLADD